jgi:hypothetical protein
VAIAVLSPLLFVVPAAIVISGKATLDALAYVGTVGTFGFMVAYALCSLAAPFWLQRLGVRTWALGFVSAVAMVFVFYKNVYPAPPSPFDVLPWIFAGLMAAGAGWYGVVRVARPQAAEEPAAS